MQRVDGRAPFQIRPLTIRRNYLDYAEGSAFVEWGKTWVLCAVSLSDDLPPWLVGTNQGWLTAEYGMLPKSTKERVARPISKGISGRTAEIQRLIGRSLRAALDLRAIGERTVRIDCDVIQADGGTRTASVIGAMVALHDAMTTLRDGGLLPGKWPIHNLVAAVSVGIVQDTPVVDLCYVEDRDAKVDMNVVMTSDGRFIEIQGTAEGEPFTQAQHDQLIDCAKRGIEAVFTVERQVLGLTR